MEFCERTFYFGKFAKNYLMHADTTLIEGLRTMHNFNSGPSVLPKEVFEEASRAIINFRNSGLSILEVGHRTPLFQDVMDEARMLVKELMDLDDDREVLFLHGGASTQFMQVPMNLLDENEIAAYTETGVFADKAIKEAKIFGKVDIVCSSRTSSFNFIPKEFPVPDDAKYLHITTNNTIYGTQWQKIPSVNIPLVADMSSDILSRVIDFNSFDLIYAGAQKNIGAAGVNLVVVNKNILGKIKRTIPAIMDYRNHIKEGSMLNTPPVFAVYICLLTLRWLKKAGGINVMEKLNNEKADLIYKEIDENPLFTGTVLKEDRSKMNACFVINNKDLEEKFLSFTKEHNMVGIKGHRSAGGFRVSLYNALSVKSVKALIEVMKDFALRYA